MISDLLQDMRLPNPNFHLINKCCSSLENKKPDVFLLTKLAFGVVQGAYFVCSLPGWANSSRIKLEINVALLKKYYTHNQRLTKL